MTWDEHNTEILRDMWEKDHTAKEIADAVHKTRNAVIGKAHRLGLSTRESPIVYKDGSRAVPIKKTRSEACQGNGYNLGKASRKRAPNKKKVIRDETREKINTTAFGTPKRMEELEPKDCRWPIGHGSDIVFCGAEATKGAYCEKHKTISIQGKLNVEKYI